MTKSKITAFLVLLLGMNITFFAGAKLVEAGRIYEESNRVYEDLTRQVRKSPATDSQVQQINSEASYQAKEQIHIPRLDIDFEALKEINEDAVAWLYSPGTVIDYPIMKAEDYSYYLNHLPDGSVNPNGSLFIDYNCAPDFSEQLTVIYGHNMKSGKMFGSLKGYKNQDYYEKHPYMYLYTEQETFRVELIYGCVIGAGQWRDRAFMCEENLDALLAYAAHNTTFESPVKYQDGDRIAALSTCSYEFNDARYVVLGILKPA